jgi:hypothetical protein
MFKAVWKGWSIGVTALFIPLLVEDMAHQRSFVMNQNSNKLGQLPLRGNALETLMFKHVLLVV